MPTSQQRNPSPPLGQLAQSGDPRSPGRTADGAICATPGNPVYEVDDDWFGDRPARDAAPVVVREMADDLRAPELQAPPAAAPSRAQPVYEVDDEWFAEDQKAREARQLEQRELAREMGIHEVELPGPTGVAPPIDDADGESGEADLLCRDCDRVRRATRR